MFLTFCMKWGSQSLNTFHLCAPQNLDQAFHSEMREKKDSDLFKVLCKANRFWPLILNMIFSSEDRQKTFSPKRAFQRNCLEQISSCWKRTEKRRNWRNFKLTSELAQIRQSFYTNNSNWSLVLFQSVQCFVENSSDIYQPCCLSKWSNGRIRISCWRLWS